MQPLKTEQNRSEKSSPAQPNNNPALSLPLRGLHLIEASAGTGKTWTLSALIVRLILEGDYTPRQMIATTFTRAAAAELRSRIRQRLEQVRRVIKQLLAAQKSQFEHRADADQTENQTKQQTPEKQTPEQLLQLVQNEIQADLFLAYLVQRIESGKFGATDHAIAQNGWTHCLNRLDLALQAFDELFVGTLDSFCQKLLSEFAFESGQGERLVISEQEQELCAEILHDAVRQWRAKQDPRLIGLLLQTKKLHDGTAYQYSVATVMNFLSAQLAPVAMPQLDFSRLEQLKDALLAVDASAFDDFIRPDGQAKTGLSKNKYLYKCGYVLPSLLARLQQFGEMFLLTISKDSPEAKLLSSFLPDQIEQQFNKGKQHFLAQLQQISATDVLSELAQIKEELSEKLDQVEQHLTFVLSQTVRERLPVLLAERGETSFSQQMRLLANALDDPDTGALLAQQIRHRYPVALVDEFQDTNTDQDRVIARVYRAEPLDPAVCLILVGDPKQAIYGFRGGDVQTYLQVKAEIQQAQRQGKGGLHGLTVNQRSVAPLVQAVDALFLRQTDLGDGIEYPAISAGERPHPALQDHSFSLAGIDNPRPLRLITLTESKQESQQIAWQVMRLLMQAAQGDLLLEGKPLQPEHIAVLGFANYELDQVQSLLQAANIAVWRPSRCSVFESPIAQDLAALLQSMLMPYHEQRLRRALSGVLIGWDLARLDQLDHDIGLLTQQQMAFADEGQLWERQGFLAAWQLLAERLDVWTHLASQPDAERHLVNLRHLLELLHEQSERSGGTHHLLSWLMRQISQPKNREWEMERRLPSQSGVQLMTIHASKGLEFPVVLVQGLDKRRKKKTDVVFYLKPPVGQRAPQRVLGFKDQTQAHLDQHHARTEAEYRRLAYVALTRASHRLYLPLLPTDKKLPSDSHEAILSYWLGHDLAEWLAAQQHVQLESLLDTAPDISGLSAPSQPADVDSGLVARPLPKRRLSSWGMTSFSAMIREHDQRHLAVIIEQHDHDQDVDQDVDEVADEALLEVMPERQAVAVDIGLVNVDTAQRTANIDVVDQAAPSRLDWAGFEDGQFEEAQFDQRQADWETPEQFEPYDFDTGDVESGGVAPAPTEQNNLRLDALSSVVQSVSAEDDLSIEVDALTVPDWHDIPAPEDELPEIDPLEQFWLDDQVELPSLATAALVQQLDDPVRFSFPRGATSGNCLHQILEYLDPSKDEDWARTFDKQLQAHAIHGIGAESMHAWFKHIVQAKLPDGATLAGLGFRERVREMEFYLALPSGEVDASRLLNRLAESGVHLPNLRHTHAVRYLKGSIDLVYQHNGQFYVADYKSNYLGGQLADYQPERLRLAMDHAGYWLQAALYLVALHRYLKVRLPDYRIERHLGGANYLFLRGMRADDAAHGILAWRPEPSLIEDLDAILAGQSLRSRANV